MKLQRLLTTAVVALSLAAGAVLAQGDKAAKQAEVRKATDTALEKFYRAEPKLRAEVEQAPGYAVFTTFGLSFILGGAGGKGLVHDNKTKQITYMDLAKASAGFQAGIAESETLIIFKSERGMQDFVNKGWEFGGGGAAQAGAAGKSVGPASGVAGYPEATNYTLTKNGLQAGVALSGVKVWRDKELN
ncbi:MAG TPA: YSC84-related protein [Burkholderiales bacterium]|nr:YSC84-related protein [Burkholderiales bacterium]